MLIESVPISSDQKILTLHDMLALRPRLREKKRKVGFIAGCFDILHVDHIELFRFARQQCDILVVGMDSDESVQLSKRRLINKFAARAELVAEMQSPRFVFGLEGSFDFHTTTAYEFHQWLYHSLRPDVIVTRPSADLYWERKQARCEALGISFVPFDAPTTTSGTQILYSLLDLPYELKTPKPQPQIPSSNELFPSELLLDISAEVD